MPRSRSAVSFVGLVFVGFEDVLAQRYALCDQRLDLPNLSLRLYARSEACCAPPAVPLLRYDLPVKLEHAAVLDVRPDAVDLLVGLSVGDDVPANTYTLSFYALDGENRAQAQADLPLPPDRYGCQIVTLHTGDLPPGTYAMGTTLYNWATGEQVNAVNTDTGERGTLHTVTTFDWR